MERVRHHRPASDTLVQYYSFLFLFVHHRTTIAKQIHKSALAAGDLRHTREIRNIIRTKPIANNQSRKQNGHFPNINDYVMHAFVRALRHGQTNTDLLVFPTTWVSMQGNMEEDHDLVNRVFVVTIYIVHLLLPKCLSISKEYSRKQEEFTHFRHRFNVFD